MSKRTWVEIREKKTKKLIRIVYNPYQSPTKKIIEMFIPVENLKKVYGVRTTGKGI